MSSHAIWYLMRASGFVAYGLLTVAVCLGIANVARWRTGRWTRTVGAIAHRNASLLAVVFLGVHIATAVLDPYMKTPLLAAVVPGLSFYDPLWVGLGALSVDLMIALVVTSLLRARIGRRAWRAVHWVAYVSWPVALLHAVGSGAGSGADTGHPWSTAIYLASAAAVGVAASVRLSLTRGATGPGDSWRTA